MRYKEKEVKPVEKVELDIKHVKLRFIVVILLIFTVIGAGIFALVSVLKKDNGWTEITVDSKSEYFQMGDEFNFQYSLGASGTSATKENRDLTALYTEELSKDYRLFDSYKSYEFSNVYTINHSINQAIEVDPVLYSSLQEVVDWNPNFLAMGPIIRYYEVLGVSEGLKDSDIDPHQNKEVQEYFNEILSYISNGDITITFLDNNRIKLNVSKEYESFMKENEEDMYLSFGYLRDAYILENVSNRLTKEGYTYGTLSSFSGYFVNLYDTSLYDISIVDWYENGVNRLCTIETSKKVRGIQFRSFPALNSLDTMYYYPLSSGGYLSTYISTKDGLDKHSLDSLTVYSNTLSLPRIAMAGYEAFVKDSFDKKDLKKEELEYCYREDTIIHYSEKLYGFYPNSALIEKVTGVWDND